MAQGFSRQYIHLVLGDDYYNADGRAITFSSDQWADLTSATVKMTLGNYEITGTVVTAGSGIQTVRFEIAKTVTEKWKTGEVFMNVVATLASTHKATIVVGRALLTRS